MTSTESWEEGLETARVATTQLGVNNRHSRLPGGPGPGGFGQREEGPQSWNLSQAHCPSRGKEALGLQVHIPTSRGKRSGKESQAWSQFPHLYSGSSRLAVVAFIQSFIKQASVSPTVAWDWCKLGDLCWPTRERDL